MTVETDGAERVLDDAFSRFKQSHAEVTRAIETMKLSLSERRAACPALIEVADGEVATSMTGDGSDCRSCVPDSPSISLIPTVDMLE
jgi:hypothetical protein